MDNPTHKLLLERDNLLVERHNLKGHIEELQASQKAQDATIKRLTSELQKAQADNDWRRRELEYQYAEAGIRVGLQTQVEVLTAKAKQMRQLLENWITIAHTIPITEDVYFILKETEKAVTPPA